MPQVKFDVRDVTQASREVCVKVFDADSGQEIPVTFERQQTLISAWLQPGRYRIVVESDPDLERQDFEIVVPETRDRRPLRKLVFLPQKGTSHYYYQGGVRIPYQRQPQQVAVSFRSPRQAGGAPADSSAMPLVVELDDGTHLTLKPISPQPQPGQATQVFQIESADEVGADQVKQVMAKLATRGDVRRVGQVLDSGTSSKSPVLTDTLIIYFKAGVDRRKARDIATKFFGKEHIQKFEQVSLGENSYELRLNDASYEILDQADKLAQERAAAIIRIEPSLIYPAALAAWTPPNDQHYNQQADDLEKIGVLTAWQLLDSAQQRPYGSPDVVIGVLDDSTIVRQEDDQRITHPEFSGKVRKNAAAPPVKKLVKAWDIDDEQTSSKTQNEHAYAVTGSVTAMTNNKLYMAGIAGNCRLISVGRGSEQASHEELKPLVWMSGRHTADSVFSKGDYDLSKASQLSQLPSLGADIINNSWGHVIPSPHADDFPAAADDGPTRILRLLATQGREGKGMLLVFAAGNDDPDGQCADCFDLNNNPYVINVAAVCAGETGNKYERARYSRYGDCIDVCTLSGRQPQGCGIKTIVTLAGDGLTPISGTSMAAPQVSGALALALSAHPELTREQAVTLLHESADHINYPQGERLDADSDFKGKWYDRYGDGIPDFSRLYGYGMLNVGRLVRLGLLTAQRGVYLRAGDGDDGDLFKRQGPAWDSPSLVVEPALGGQGWQARAEVFNGSAQPLPAAQVANLRVQFHAAAPTTLATADLATLKDVLGWSCLGEAGFGAGQAIPPGGSVLSQPVPCSASELLRAQVTDVEQPPGLFDLNSSHPGDYATLARWTGLLAWKQPGKQCLTLPGGCSDSFSFNVGLGNFSPASWVALRFDFIQVTQGIKVSITLAKDLIDSLLKNNNQQLPPGVTRPNDTTLRLDPGLAGGKRICLAGLKLPQDGPGCQVQLVLKYPNTSGVYEPWIEVSQYIDGYWVGMVKRQVEATIT